MTTMLRLENYGRIKFPPGRFITTTDRNPPKWILCPQWQKSTQMDIMPSMRAPHPCYRFGTSLVHSFLRVKIKIQTHLLEIGKTMPMPISILISSLISGVSVWDPVGAPASPHPSSAPRRSTLTTHHHQPPIRDFSNIFTTSSTHRCLHKIKSAPYQALVPFQTQSCTV